MLKKHLGFTLSEVLITLGLIGVVSAMTIPTLAYNYRSRVLEQQFRTTYNDVGKVAGLLVMNRSEDIGQFAQFSGSGFARNFMARIPGGSEYKSEDTNLRAGIFDMKLLKEYYKTARFPQGPFSFFPRTDLSEREAFCNGGGIWTDSRGRIWGFNKENNVICVDINGASAPNRYNIDIFAFVPMTAAQVATWVYDDSGNPSKYTGEIVLCDLNHMVHFGLLNKLPERDEKGLFIKGKGGALDSCPFNAPLNNIAPVDKDKKGFPKGEYGTSAKGEQVRPTDEYWTKYINYK